MNLKKRIFQKIEDMLNIENSMEKGLLRSIERNILPSTIIDVGAAQGKWSLKAMKYWNNADYVLFEPLQERKDHLNKLAKKCKNIHVINKGAGNEQNTIDFFVTDDLDGSGVADNGTNAKKTQIEITTIDFEIKKLKLPSPFLIKLDTHGFEVPIIEGAKETLKNTSLIIVECYGFFIAQNSFLFHQMCNLLYEKGFRLIDIVDIRRRPKDNTFWQCDAFFVPMNRPEFDSNTYN